MKTLRPLLLAFAATAVLGASAEASLLDIFHRPSDRSTEPAQRSDNSALRATRDENLAEDRNREAETRSHSARMSSASRSTHARQISSAGENDR